MLKSCGKAVILKRFINNILLKIINYGKGFIRERSIYFLTVIIFRVLKINKKIVRINN